MQFSDLLKTTMDGNNVAIWNIARIMRRVKNSWVFLSPWVGRAVAARRGWVRGMGTEMVEFVVSGMVAMIMLRKIS